MAVDQRVLRQREQDRRHKERTGHAVALDRLEKRFPGSGSLVDRYDTWRRAFNEVTAT